MRALLVGSASLALAACGCTPSDAPPPRGGASAPPPYAGPELKATIATEESRPPRYALAVDVNCPTGGYKLTLANYDDKSTPREVKLILESPATDELVIEAFVKHTERVDLGTQRTPVRVLVSRRQRRNPDAAEQPFELAATVTPQ